MSAEQNRLSESASPNAPWRQWGPYVSARQWGTVREDYSADGNAWTHFPFDHAHQRTYRWGEDGIAGLCDLSGYLNLAVALWNGHDDRLKERLFGLTNPQGNHGEDVKEYWWAVDATPTHSYAELLYRYPQQAFPYRDLLDVNDARGYHEPEYELTDTGIFDQNRFFDVTVTHAKGGPDDILVLITATNHGPDAAPIDIVPQWWFRNTWSWGDDFAKPNISVGQTHQDYATLVADHELLGRVHLYASGQPQLLFCDNETNAEAVFDQPSSTQYPKDAIDRTIVGGVDVTNPERAGTKAGIWWRFESVAPGASVTVQLRMTVSEAPAVQPFADFEAIVQQRASQADEFYADVIPASTSDVDRHIARRAFAGLLWGKQLYLFDVNRWIAGDPAATMPVGQHLEPRYPRNHSWRHMNLAEVISMPDEWEYPWFAAWDLAFHCVSLAHIDPDFAKFQMLLMCREWAMHPNGQLPAYEWNFGDVNPPAHVWAAWQIYAIDGFADADFLERLALKMMLNFPWWVNRKDADGSHVFEGGFLGMDNVGLFDRSDPLPDGQRLEQADATAWMGMFCLRMFRMACELARTRPAWDEVATKFLVHFLEIDRAMGDFGSQQTTLWDSDDNFYHDIVTTEHGEAMRMPVRSMVGLLPMTSIAVVPPWLDTDLPDLKAFLQGWIRRRPEKANSLLQRCEGGDGTRALSMPSADQWDHLLRYLLDESEFLAPHGIRSLSAAHRDGVHLNLRGQDLHLAYNPGESDSGMFGGNSNWRGPIWFPVNAMLTDALRIYGRSVGSDLKLEFPTGSGDYKSLVDIAAAIEDRMISLFRPDQNGRPVSAPRHHPSGPLWDVHPTFSEYFDGDNGLGLGASHQTGWTALVAHFICSPAGVPTSGV